MLLISLACILTIMAQVSNATEYTATPIASQVSSGDTTHLQFVQTDSPRDTFQTFLRLTAELENALLVTAEDDSRDGIDNVVFLGSQFMQLFDLSSVPQVLQREIGIETLGFMLDIIGRLDLPAPESIPDADAFEDDESPATWRIPGSPVRIVEIEDGPRAGEFLFSQRTVSVAPDFYQRIRHLPLRSSIEITSWTETIPQWHGPMIPTGLVDALPDGLKLTWLDAPIWKIILVLALSTVAVILLAAWHRVISQPGSGIRLVARLRQLSTPIVMIIIVAILLRVFLTEIYITGIFARAIGFTGTLVIFLAAAWIFWHLVLLICEWIILSPKIPDESLDANVIRLVARVIGFIGVLVIGTYGASKLGFPVVGLMTGLGVGGLAVALAIKPTLENFIGGIMLYIDKPVRLGDFCSFGDKMGTVEHIGIRSTQIRALDRTMVSIPNSIFVDMEIINWAKCDRMLIRNMIGLRYETEPDQMRYVLTKLREMLHAHPKIDSGTVRVRFAGYGASSLDVDIRVYALTREWNEFYAIREDVFLRVNEIVEQSGTGFAFPSQTLYLRRDDGLDEELSDAAKQQLQSWRRSGEMPFPNLPASKIEQLADTLDYPPRGSPDADPSKSQHWEATEPLSAEDGEVENIEKNENVTRKK
ncbi:MAG: mechanosensitive ion channel family protein [Gammaproteobacteria bacterium]|nr:mechanosensitive ion channel family protein [Gammaproteobacteria bacterium]